MPRLSTNELANLNHLANAGDIMAQAVLDNKDAIAQVDGSDVNAADLSSTSAGKGASLIGVQDAANKYLATTVEDALAEVKALADATRLAPYVPALAASWTAPAPTTVFQALDRIAAVLAANSMKP